MAKSPLGRDDFENEADATPVAEEGASGFRERRRGWSDAHRRVDAAGDQFDGRRGCAAAPRMGKYDQLWQLSMADPHTGLANQLLLLDRLTLALARRRRHGGEVVVCHINLDNLAEINLDLGYTTGNAVLCDASRRLTSVLRAEDTVGRVGGSELVVVITVNDEQAVAPSCAVCSTRSTSP